MRTKMIRKLFLFTLLSIFSSLSVFGDENNSYKIYLKNRDTGKSIELTDQKKNILIQYIDKLRVEKTEQRKIRCQYEILLVLENEIKYYKTNGRYLSVSGNDLYIRCSEVMDIIVKTGI